MIKKIFSLLIFLSLFLTNYSQKILLEQDVRLDSIIPSKGPNYKHFFHSYINYGLIIPTEKNDSAATILGSSYEVAIGFRYKRKITNFYSLGFDLFWNSRSFNLKQDSLKIFPEKAIHDKAKLVQGNLGLAFHNRFNLDIHRGNKLGKYIDIGIYGEFNFRGRYITQDKHTIANTVGASKTKQQHSGLVYLNSFNYGVLARISLLKSVTLFSSYRLSEIFKSKYIYPELPRLTIGIELPMIQ